MRRAGPRFTIRALMIAVAAVACVLGIPLQWWALALLLLIPIGSVVGTVLVARYVYQSHRRGIGALFLTWAVGINLAYAAACIAPDSYLCVALFLGLFVFVTMTTILGVAWLHSLRRETAPDGVVTVAGLTFAALAVLPVVTLATFWPLHLAFALSRPSMDRAVNQVLAARVARFPRSVGLYGIESIHVDRPSRVVALFTNANPNGPSGFVRVPTGKMLSWDTAGVVGSNLRIDLGGGWWYCEDD